MAATQITALDSVISLTDINASASGLIADNRLTRLIVDAAFTGAITRNIIGGGDSGVEYNAPAALTGNIITGNVTGVVASVISNADGLGYAAGSGRNTITGNTTGVRLLAGQLVNQLIQSNTTGVSGSIVFQP